ncbi:DUF397 domain-containing protein [Streptomyces sparsogenes]|uniref:DUF397 domain-containing protein n=1 Tax=Streptomyces sparsogenes TaxID=67365 RepID=UPI0033FFF4F0
MPARAWRKSSYSAQGSNCVYVAAPTSEDIKIRDSDEPDVILTAAPATLDVFIRAAKAGRFDHPTTARPPRRPPRRRRSVWPTTPQSRPSPRSSSTSPAPTG